MKFKKRDLTYLFILHIVWILVDYYSEMFGIDLYQLPSDMSYKIFEEEGKTVLRFSFPSIPTKNTCSVTDMAEIMEEYLQYCLLPQQTELQPYQSGSTLVEPLHVMAVRPSLIGYEIDILYVNNPVACQYAKAHYGAIYTGGI